MAIKVIGTTVIDDSRNLTNIGNVNTTGIATFGVSSTVLIGTGTSTGTISQSLQVGGGAYVSGSVGVGTTTYSSVALSVNGDAIIGNRASYYTSPRNLFRSFGTENDITFPGSTYQLTTVGCATDVGTLNNTYFTIYGPGGTSSAIDTVAAEQNVVFWFNVAGAGSTPSVVGAGRSVGIAITSGASNISIGNTIASLVDAGFTIGSSGDGNVVFVAKTPDTFSNPSAGTAVGFAVTSSANGSGSLSGSDKWVGGVLAPNGKIYGIPYNSTSVLVIDPATNTTSTFGSLGSGIFKWFGGVLAPNGKIYGIPYRSTSVLVIDPATNTTSTFGSLSGNDKWGGGVLAPNGKIYGIPVNSTSVLVIDPAANTTSTFGSLSGISKWFGGVLAPNGKIYGIPLGSTSVLSIGGGTASIPDWYLYAYQNKF